MNFDVLKISYDLGAFFAVVRIPSTQIIQTFISLGDMSLHGEYKIVFYIFGPECANATTQKSVTCLPTYDV